jgi:hypothetical protein
MVVAVAAVIKSGNWYIEATSTVHPEINGQVRERANSLALPHKTP